MLKQLSIQNYALIKELQINPSDKLNTITGETGAGKSIMLGAVGLLLGNRADTKVLLDDSSKCIIEGQFEVTQYNLKSIFEKEDLDYDDQTIIRREITPAGKSRAFVNDSPVTLDTLKKLGVKLMDIHSQHETLQLGQNSFQLKFVDVVADALALRSQVAASYKNVVSRKKELDSLTFESSEIKKEADYNSFLLEELSALNLVEDEQEALEAKVKLMEYAEEIKLKLNESLQVLNGEELSIIQGISQLKQLVAQLSKYSDSYSQLAERIESCSIELIDISAEIEREEEQINFDPEEALQAQERLSKIYHLQQKHQVQTIGELITIEKELAEKVSRSQSLDDDIAKAEDAFNKALKEANDKALQLSKSRIKSFATIEKQLKSLLAEVGMPDATVEIKRDESELSLTGIDHIKILFSANKGVSPQELSKVASGGEFSRLMFCLKYILAEKVSLPTIIFDEIDTGVSGEIALKMGAMMNKMSANHQVITITHLPQIASKGDRHYFVYKDNTEDVTISKIKELSGDERITEVAKMIGGDNPTDTAYQNAKELMQSA